MRRAQNVVCRASIGKHRTVVEILDISREGYQSSGFSGKVAKGRGVQICGDRQAMTSINK